MTSPVPIGVPIAAPSLSRATSARTAGSPETAVERCRPSPVQITCRWTSKSVPPSTEQGVEAEPHSRPNVTPRRHATPITAPISGISDHAHRVYNPVDKWGSSGDNFQPVLTIPNRAGCPHRLSMVVSPLRHAVSSASIHLRPHNPQCLLLLLFSSSRGKYLKVECVYWSERPGRRNHPGVTQAPGWPYGCTPRSRTSTNSGSQPPSARQHLARPRIENPHLRGMHHRQPTDQQ